MEGRTWRPRARRVARLARFVQCGGRLTLPHPRPLPKGRSRSRPRFCTWGRQPPRPKSGRLAHLAQVEDHKSDVGDRCSGELSWRVHGSGQPKQLSTGASASPVLGYAGGPSAAGGCAAVWRPRHVRRAAGDSGCTIGGAVPEFGRPAAHIRESVVGPPGLTPPFAFSGLPARP